MSAIDPHHLPEGIHAQAISKPGKKKPKTVQIFQDNLYLGEVDIYKRSRWSRKKKATTIDIPCSGIKKESVSIVESQFTGMVKKVATLKESINNLQNSKSLQEAKKALQPVFAAFDIDLPMLTDTFGTSPAQVANAKRAKEVLTYISSHYSVDSSDTPSSSSASTAASSSSASSLDAGLERINRYIKCADGTLSLLRNIEQSVGDWIDEFVGSLDVIDQAIEKRDFDALEEAAGVLIDKAGIVSLPFEENRDWSDKADVLETFDCFKDEDFHMLTPQAAAKLVYDRVCERAQIARQCLDNKDAILLAEKYNSFSETIETSKIKPLPEKGNCDTLMWAGVFGAKGSGESCLLLRLSDDTYTESFISTIGVDFKDTRMEYQATDGSTTKTKFHVCDTDHNQRFRNIITSYHPGRTKLMLVTYDLSLPPEEAKHQAEKFVAEFRTFAADSCKLVLVGTKLDTALGEEGAARLETFKALAEEKVGSYCCVSSKLGVGFDHVRRFLTHRAEEVNRKSDKEPYIRIG